jgi:hypothetical protein
VFGINIGEGGIVDPLDIGGFVLAIGFGGGDLAFSFAWGIIGERDWAIIIGGDFGDGGITGFGDGGITGFGGGGGGDIDPKVDRLGAGRTSISASTINNNSWSWLFILY